MNISVSSSSWFSSVALLYSILIVIDCFVYYYSFPLILRFFLLKISIIIYTRKFFPHCNDRRYKTEGMVFRLLRQCTSHWRKRTFDCFWCHQTLSWMSNTGERKKNVVVLSVHDKLTNEYHRLIRCDWNSNKQTSHLHATTSRAIMKTLTSWWSTFLLSSYVSTIALEKILLQLRLSSSFLCSPTLAGFFFSTSYQTSLFMSHDQRTNCVEK